MRISDWSSDVCSSDLFACAKKPGAKKAHPACAPGAAHRVRGAGALCVAKLIGQQCIDEGLGVEHAQVFRAFADAGVADRDAELARPREHHAALGAAVELGYHQPGARSAERRVGKECVLTCNSRGSPDDEKKKK